MLLGEALLEAGGNLDHRRSPLIRLTGLGRQKYIAVDRRQIRWINDLSAGLDVSDLADAARLLRELSEGWETPTEPAGGATTMKLRELDDTVTYRQQLQDDDGQAVLINQFNLAPEDTERFLQVWADDAAFMKDQPVLGQPLVPAATELS